MQLLSLVTLLVDDYDRAIAHYCGALGFALREDTDLGRGKPWVRVAPPGDGTTDLLLAAATT
ncbi:MAG: VOC family protein, partial [Pseudoxanthomonas sp.]|nr:VOC family protein [Pseudoxanthomonas sp.]